MRTGGVALFVVLLLATAAHATSRATRRCRMLCKAAVSACVTSGQEALAAQGFGPAKVGRKTPRVRRRCTQNLVRACRKDPAVCLAVAGSSTTTTTSSTTTTTTLAPYVGRWTVFADYVSTTKVCDPMVSCTCSGIFLLQFSANAQIDAVDGAYTVVLSRPTRPSVTLTGGLVPPGGASPSLVVSTTSPTTLILTVTQPTPGTYAVDLKSQSDANGGGTCTYNFAGTIVPS